MREGPGLAELVRRWPRDRSRRRRHGRNRAALRGCRSAAVQPSAARSAATTPDSAARPAWNGLVMVPKFSRRPGGFAGGNAERA